MIYHKCDPGSQILFLLLILIIIEYNFLYFKYFLRNIWWMLAQQNVEKVLRFECDLIR